MANVLILGGTGFIGVPLVTKLLERGHSIVVFSRGNIRPAFGQRVQFVRGDRRSAESLRNAMAGRHFDAVIDNLAFTPADVQCAVDLFSGRVRQYILTSSVLVYGKEFANPVSEDDLSLADLQREADSFEFGKSTTAGKRQCELVLHNKFSNKELFTHFTVLRPAKIHGRHDPSPRLWWYIQRLNDGGPLVIPEGSSDPSIRHIYCDDLAAVYDKVLLNPLCENETYNIASTEIVSLNEFIRTIARSLKTNLRIIKVPVEVLKAEGLFEFSHPLLPTGGLVPAITKAEDHFKWKSIPLCDWLHVLCNWYLKTPVEDSWGYALRQKELEVASRFA